MPKQNDEFMQQREKYVYVVVQFYRWFKFYFPCFGEW